MWGDGGRCASFRKDWKTSFRCASISSSNQEQSDALSSHRRPSADLVPLRLGLLWHALGRDVVKRKHSGLGRLPSLYVVALALEWQLAAVAAHLVRGDRRRSSEIVGDRRRSSEIVGGSRESVGARGSSLEIVARRALMKVPMPLSGDQW